MISSFAYGIGIGAGIMLGVFGILIIFLIVSTFFMDRWM